MKHKLLLFVILLLPVVQLCFSNSAYADCGGLDTILIDCPSDATGEQSICHVLDDVISILAVLVGIVAAIGIVITGIQYLTAGGSEEKVRKTKRRFLELVIGLAIYAPSAALINWLSPGGLVCGGIQIMGGSNPSQSQTIDSNTSSSNASGNQTSDGDDDEFPEGSNPEGNEGTGWAS